MLYQKYETDISKRILAKIFSDLGQQVCLLGGWAVYIIVNERFQNDHGHEYHGSKDIDLGFHINLSSLKDFENTQIYKTIKYLTSSGFNPISRSYVKWFHTESKKELTEEESLKFPQPFIFQLYRYTCR